jgi:hypothetical protein
MIAILPRIPTITAAGVRDAQKDKPRFGSFSRVFARRPVATRTPRCMLPSRQVLGGDFPSRSARLPRQIGFVAIPIRRAIGPWIVP